MNRTYAEHLRTVHEPSTDPHSDHERYTDEHGAFCHTCSEVLRAA